jgi:hypothetical protein
MTFASLKLDTLVFEFALLARLAEYVCFSKHFQKQYLRSVNVELDSVYGENGLGDMAFSAATYFVRIPNVTTIQHDT